jgi:23S rRNA pseudouridine1911/1915/1917 synthase
MIQFSKDDILYEDNHLLVVNKHAGDLVQADSEGETGLEDAIKAFIRRRDGKPGDVFLGVVHRIDRPVSGAVVFAKTSKALVRLNEMLRRGEFDKTYWAIVEELPPAEEGTLTHHIVRDGKQNRSRAYDSPKKDSKEGRLTYKMIAGSSNYYLLEVTLLTGRHHQIRAQLAKVGSPIKGDLKYGAKRSNPDGGIALHSRRVSFVHPVRKEPLEIIAPVPSGDNLWRYFSDAVGGAEK